MNRLLLTALVAASVALAGPAVADGPTAEDQALATALFREAKTLLDEGKVPLACRKLEESQRLDPAAGTLLNLAVCHEREGKTATAWAEFRQARALAEHDQRDDRLQLIDMRLAVLEPQLSKLVLEIAKAVDRPDMEIKVDDRTVRRPAWGTAIPIDPGEHVIEARAPAQKPWRTNVKVGSSADLQTVVIPAWEVDVETTVTVIPVVPSANEVLPASPPSQPSPRHGRTGALIAGGVGLAGFAVGTVFGIRAITKHSDSVDACPINPCSAESFAANDASKSAADISTIAFAVGLVGLGVGAYFWWFAGGSSSAAQRRSPRILGGSF